MLNLQESANTIGTISQSSSLLGAAQTLGASDPTGTASLISTGTNIIAQLLPEDKRQKFIEGATFGLVGLVFNWIKGRPYTEGQYVLGERFCDHILKKWVDRSYIKDRPGIVANAQTFFTGALGVRIKTSEDLDALNGSPAYAAGEQLERGAKGMIDLGRTVVFPVTYKGIVYTSSRGKADKAIPFIPGVDLYYMRPDTKDIPRKAVERAANLVQKYMPYNSYNKTFWDTSVFSKFPLVAPVPDPVNVGQLMNGTLPGGMQIVNGLIAAPKTGDFLQQEGNTPITPGTSVFGSNSVLKWVLIAGGALVFILLITLLARKR